jgi:hypothetical protein
MRTKNILNNFFLFAFSFILSYAHAAPIKFPVVESFKGKAWVTDKEGHKKAATKKLILREKATLQTDGNSELFVQVTENKSIVLLADTEVIFPAIGWDHGDVRDLQLIKGAILWLEKPSSEISIKLSADLYQQQLAPGAYLYVMDPSKAFAEAQVIRGHMDFSALNAEEGVKLKEDDKVSFQGVVEGGVIVYDVLLKGKKIPRGKLSAVENVDGELKRKYADEIGWLDSVAPKKSAKAKANKAQKDNKGLICEAPNGHFNDCAWTCQGNPKKEKKQCLLQNAGVSCVRRRCNANGEWAEEMTLDAQKASTICVAKPVVAPCDY